MSSWVCVDANVVLRLVTGGDGAEQIARLWADWREAGLQIAAPGLLAYEVTNALWRYAHVGELEPDEAAMALDTALGLGVVLHNDSALHRRALELARRHGLPATYDAHYLALAEMLDAGLWTTDARLASKLGSGDDRLRLIQRS